MLIAHIIIAVSSLLISSSLLFKQSTKIFNVTYLLVASTLASGLVIVVMSPKHIISACISGLIYLAVISANLYIGNKKFSYAKITNKF